MLKLNKKLKKIFRIIKLSSKSIIKNKKRQLKQY